MGTDIQQRLLIKVAGIISEYFEDQPFRFLNW